MDTVQEVNILRSNYSAEFGRNAGRQVRDDRRALMRDRLFFFFGEEFRKIETMRGTGVNITRTPTEAQRRGDSAGLPTIVDPFAIRTTRPER